MSYHRLFTGTSSTVLFISWAVVEFPAVINILAAVGIILTTAAIVTLAITITATPASPVTASPVSDTSVEQVAAIRYNVCSGKPYDEKISDQTGSYYHGLCFHVLTHSILEYDYNTVINL